MTSAEVPSAPKEASDPLGQPSRYVHEAPSSFPRVQTLCKTAAFKAQILFSSPYSQARI